MTDIETPIESNLVEHARRELRLAGMFDADADYGPEFADHIVDVVRAFSGGGHSGGSAHLAASILDRLLRYQPLTPLTADPEEWQHHDETVWGAPGGIWQNRRDSTAFSENGGATWYKLGYEWQVGDHVYHDTTGRYLGQVTGVLASAVKLDGPPLLAGFDEIRLGPVPATTG